MKKKSENSTILILFWIILGMIILLSLGRYQSTKIEEDTKPPTGQLEDINNKIDSISNSGEEVRPSFFGGKFYPDQAYVLKQKLSALLNDTNKLEKEDKVRFLLLPHAGLEYSGKIAASGYKQVNFSQYDRVVIMGSSHVSNNDKVSVYSEGAWATPLGQSRVDSSFAQRLIDESAHIVFDKDMHTNDHILEMQLIFIQNASLDTKIVPISIGNVNLETLEILANKLAFLTDERTLYVVSADLSHYPKYEQANEVDKKTIASVLQGDPKEFSTSIKNRNNELEAGLETFTCGEKAIYTLLTTAEILNIQDISLIKYSNSGDAADDKNKVVGYAAIEGRSSKIEPFSLNQRDKEEALLLANGILKDYLETKEVNLISTTNPSLYVPMGVFSTINNKDTLRGCIGAFSPTEPLYYSLQRLTLEAAINDKRFVPVKRKELDNLSIELSFMSEKTKVESISDIEMGIHGVQIANGKKSGTFLPEVADSFNMEKIPFLEELCVQKANLPKDCYNDPQTNIFIFTTDKTK